uniref:Uncharacterized protein n=1 Tax=Cacopsylla melanoneura TaxID=428564 RepID=A0A8D8WJ67_9HEMI
MLNESMIKVQENLEAYSMKHGLNCDTQFDVPAKDGMTIIYNGLRHFRSEMMSWIKHTLVDKPKSLVRQQKILLEVFTDNDTLAIPRSKIRDFWRFERCFANMLRYYEHELTERVFQHYDKLLLHYISHTGGSNDARFHFPRTLPSLADHLVAHEHIFTMDLRNDTTTEYVPIGPLFTLDEELKKGWAEQRRDVSGDYRDSVDEPRPWI